MPIHPPSLPVESLLLSALVAATAPKCTRLADGTTGYYCLVGRSDTCWQAAVATCLQIPLRQVPDARIEERLRAGDDPQEVNNAAWSEFRQWLDARGLRMVTHKRVPAARDRWIGVVPWRGWFRSHCLILNRAEILFDPSAYRIDGAPPTIEYELEDIAFGYSFARRPHTTRGDKRAYTDQRG